MLLFEFVVAGPPVSQQTRRRERIHEWKAFVRAAAQRTWVSGRPPLDESLLVEIYYFYEASAADVDNIAKPMHDALKGLVFADDGQITDSVVRRRDLRGTYTVRALTPVLAGALDGGREFLYVAVSTAPGGGELP